MKNDSPQTGLLEEMGRAFRRFVEAGDLSAIENRDQWDGLLESQSPEERELLRELSRFADLWRYFRERDEKLGLETVNAIGRLRELSISERILQLRTINRKLMEQVGNVGEGAQFRN